MVKNYFKELKSVRVKVKDISVLLIDANKKLIDAIKSCNDEDFDKAKDFLKNMRPKTDEIDNEIVKILALYTPEAKDLRELIAYLKITNELLRASSNTRSFIKNFRIICINLDENIVDKYLLPLWNATLKSLEITNEMLDIGDIDEVQDRFNEVVVEENKTDDLIELLEKELLDSIKDIQDYNVILSTFRKSEKIADRAYSVANLLVYSKIGGSLTNK